MEDPSEGEPGLDLSGIDQLVEVGQSRLIATLLQKQRGTFNNVGLDRCLDVSLPNGDLVAVRQLELTAALSRLRGIVVAQ